MDILNQDIDILHAALELFEFSMGWSDILIMGLSFLLVGILYRYVISKCLGSEMRYEPAIIMLVNCTLMLYIVYWALSYHDQSMDHSERVILFIQSSQLSQGERIKLKTYINQSPLPTISDRVKAALTQHKKELETARDAQIRERDNARLQKQLNQI